MEKCSVLSVDKGIYGFVPQVCDSAVLFPRAMRKIAMLAWLLKPILIGMLISNWHANF